MLRIAKVLKSNGTDGGILLGLHGIEIEEIDLQEPVFIVFDGLPVPFFIESIQPRGNSKAIVHVTDVRNLRDAEELVGKEIFIEGQEEEAGDEDFTGWTVYDRDTRVGVVTDIAPIPGNLCLYVQTAASEEVMIPLHEDFILEADPQKKELTLELPEGLY